jgi:CDP-diacylglycerol--glycerol-3-phosphate 3-phosphatidyltransferase
MVEDKTQSLINPIASFLHRCKISANILTLSGLVVNGIAAYYYYQGLIVLGGIGVLIGGLFDTLDGAVARSSGNPVRAGAFSDSVVDRYSDFIVLGAILAFFAKKGDFQNTILLLIVICGTFLVSYIRARAELVIPKCRVGVMERPERVILLALGSLTGFLDAAIWILAIGTHLTALHRIYFTYKTLKQLHDE